MTEHAVEFQSSPNSPPATNRRRESSNPIFPSVIAFYVAAIAIGTAGSALFIKNEKEGDNNLTTRVIYSCMFLAAGILITVAKTAARIKNQEWRSNLDADQAEDIEEAKEAKSEEKKAESKESAASPDILSPILTTPPKRYTPDFASPSPGDPFSPVKGDSKFPFSPTSAHLDSPSPPFAARTTTPAPSQFLSKLSSLLSWIPPFWFAQTLTLCSQILEHETAVARGGAPSPHQWLLPNTRITSFIAGLLFYLSINPLPRLRTVISHNRNTVILLAYFSIRNLLRNSPDELARFTATVSAFLMGMNAFELTAKITRYAVGQSTTAPKPLEELPHIPFFSAAFLSFMGVGLVSSAFMILNLVPEDEEGLRDFFSLWLISLGGIMSTYKPGEKLGQSIPQRFHHRFLTLIVQFLVAAASPELSYPHVALILCAGLFCGGAHFFINASRTEKMERMRTHKSELDLLIGQANPQIISLLATADLGRDVLFDQEVQSRASTKKLFNILIGIYTLVSLALIPIFQASDGMNAVWRTTISAVSIAVALSNLNYVLPRIAPSIYSLRDLTFLQDLFCSEQFLIPTLAKIAFTISYNNDFLGNKAEIANVSGFDFWVVVFFLTALIHKRFHGGYKPYVLSDEEMAIARILLGGINSLDEARANLKTHITQMKVRERTHRGRHSQSYKQILELERWTREHPQQFPLPYHFGQFIRENCEHAIAQRKEQPAATAQRLSVLSIQESPKPFDQPVLEFPIIPDQPEPELFAIPPAGETPPVPVARRLSISTQGGSIQLGNNPATFFAVRHSDPEGYTAGLFNNPSDDQFALAMVCGSDFAEVFNAPLLNFPLTG